MAPNARPDLGESVQRLDDRLAALGLRLTLRLTLARGNGLQQHTLAVALRQQHAAVARQGQRGQRCQGQAGCGGAGQFAAQADQGCRRQVGDGDDFAGSAAHAVPGLRGAVVTWCRRASTHKACKPPAPGSGGCVSAPSTAVPAWDQGSAWLLKNGAVFVGFGFVAAALNCSVSDGRAKASFCLPANTCRCCASAGHSWLFAALAQSTLPRFRGRAGGWHDRPHEQVLHRFVVLVVRVVFSRFRSACSASEGSASR